MSALLLVLVIGLALGGLLVKVLLPKPKAKVIYWAHPPMSDEQLRNALGSVTLEDPLLRAILQVLQENIDCAASEVGAIGIADKPGTLAHTAGGLEWLQFLQADIASLMTGEQRRQFKPSSAGVRTEEAADE